MSYRLAYMSWIPARGGELVSVAQVLAAARKTKIASFGVGSNPTSWASRGSRGGGDDAARGAS